MITEVKEKRVMSIRQVDSEFDGKWAVLDTRAFPAEGKGYLVAYGDGTPQDCDVLQQIVWKRFNGDALLLKGHTPKEYVYAGVYDC